MPAAPAAGRPESPGALLARLNELKDEQLQAERNPELWAVIEAVRAQIARCWSLGAGLEQRFRVDIDVAFDRSGRLLKARIRDAGALIADAGFRDFATGATGLGLIILGFFPRCPPQPDGRCHRFGAVRYGIGPKLPPAAYHKPYRTPRGTRHSASQR